MPTSKQQTPKRIMPKKNLRTFSGIVVSNKMLKTLVVRVERTVVHPKYGKRFMRSQKFHVHDERHVAHIGDTVRFCACRPLSKTKCWRVIPEKE